MALRLARLGAATLLTAMATGMVAPAASAAPAPLGTYLAVAPSNRAASHVPAVAAAGGRVSAVLENIDVLIVRMSATAAARLDALPGWHVEAEQVFRVSDTQSSPTNWALDRTDQVDRPLSRSYTYPATEAGSGVTAYIMDTGIRRDHQEFVGRLAAGWYGYADTSGTGDCQGHGTHVAGSVAGTLAGIAKSATLVPVAVLGCDGSGSSTVIAAGADWIIADRAARGGTPAVVNMSLGGSASTAIDTAVSKMITAGIPVVVAAGNSGQDACRYSPARVGAAITVGATDSSDARASWSNFGSCLDLFAPGVSITSADHAGATAFSTKSGTSMASPHAAGVVARYLSAHPAASPATVWSALSPTLSANRVTAAGTGSPNLLLYADPDGYAASTDATAPAQPTGVATTSVTNSSMTVSWLAPASDGGSAITGYRVQTSTLADFSSSTLVTTGSAARSVTLSGLTASTTYYVRVAAVNAAGASDWSASASATTTAAVAMPGAVTALSVTATSRSTLGLTWTPPAGTVGSYQLQVSTKSTFSGATVTTLSGSSSSASVAGLKAGTRYYVRIRAVNSAGAGAWASGSAVTPR